MVLKENASEVVFIKPLVFLPENALRRFPPTAKAKNKYPMS
jgi:hypothetical protein